MFVFLCIMRVLRMPFYLLQLIEIKTAMCLQLGTPLFVSYIL